MSISYRQLTAADAPQYREIRLESLRLHPESFGSGYEQQRALPRLMFEQALLQPTDARFLVGVFDGEQLVGICGCLPFAPGAAHAWPKTAVIIQMYVQATYRGRRLGLGLMEQTMAAAFALPGIDRVMLGVVKGNESARRVYERAGLRIVNGDETDAAEHVMVIERDQWTGDIS